MVLAVDHSDLPKPAKLADDGRRPDTDPRFVQILVEGWAEIHGDDKPRAFEDTRFRHSDAGKCARAIGYAAIDLPASNPMDLSGRWNVGLGTIIHEAWQTQLHRRYPDADIEPKVRTDAGSGHIDAVIRTDGHVTAVELKSIGGFAFKLAVGERGSAQGPKFEHVVQAALNGMAVDADEIVVAYLSKEAISVAAAQRKGFDEIGRFAAEWTYTRDEFEPIAAAEIERVTKILALVDEGLLPARKVPGGELPAGHEITDPAKGTWEARNRDGDLTDVGSFWMCGYCRWQTTCASTPSGRIPVSAVQLRAAS